MEVYGPHIVLDGLVFYLDAANKKSYPGNGTIWNDLTSYSKKGLLINGTTYDSDNGGSILFDGEDDGVNFDNLNLPNSGARTITTWFKSTGTDACSIFAYGNINTPSQSNILHLNIVGNGSIYWAFNNADFYTNPLLDNSSYYFITCTYNGGVLDTNNVKIYLNGIELSVTGIGGNIGQYPNTIDTSYSLGYDNGIRYFKGNISVFSFYNRALTDSEVVQNYNAMRTRFL